MKYIVMEIQDNNGTVANLVTAYDEQRAAESAYHTILASAAVSNLTVHTAVLLDETGFVYETRSYKGTEPAPEPESEPESNN